ncbi:YafY family protein [Brevibacterium daeguense]|uniref:YafY family protein n=2 Tax=Brevibacterium daeguense TaxID=909936 RepID=A0ABP8EJW2_9MICO
MLDLLAILATGRQLSAAELAAQLGASVRTVRRDIALLREQGYRIDAAPGVGGGYAAPAGAVLPPLQFTPDEVFTVALALRTLAGQGVRGPGAAREQTAHVETAVRKLRSVLPPAIAASIDRATEAISAAPGNEPEVPIGTLAAVASAVAERRLIDLRYRGLATESSVPGSTGSTGPIGEGEERRVEPYRVVVFGGHWYLVAWDRSRDAWRTFRLDRITRSHITTFDFRPRQTPDPVEFVRRQVTAAVYPTTVRARVAAPAAEVSAAIPARAGTVVATGADECEVVLGAAGPQWVIMLLLGLEKPFTVLDPPGFHVEVERFRRNVDLYLG